LKINLFLISRSIADPTKDFSQQPEHNQDQQNDKKDSDGETKVRRKLLFDDPHVLQVSYTFWYMKRTPGARSQENYERNIKKVGAFDCVEEFWSYYNHMIRPIELPTTSDYHLFKTGIKPMWEDDANKVGGKWIVRLKKGLSSRLWEDLVLAIIGEQFNVGHEICGIVVSIRYQEDIISVWNKSANDTKSKERIRDTMKRVLSLPPGTIMEYKNHDAAMKDNSSFRNTDVFR